MTTTEPLLRPVLGAAEIEPIVDRLAAIYRRARKLEAAAAPANDRAIEATPFAWRPPETIPTRMASVKDAASGLRYAAWCIGETLIAVGGLELAHWVFAAFENRFPEDPTAGGWLDHRWNGAGGPNGHWVS